MAHAVPSAAVLEKAIEFLMDEALVPSEEPLSKRTQDIR
jgi:hypothetical protein